jgi:hypothetical protein
MATIHLDMDEATLDRVQRLADASNCSLEDLLSQLIAGLPEQTKPADSILGLMADEPELVDEILAAAMKAREERVGIVH